MKDPRSLVARPHAWGKKKPNPQARRVVFCLSMNTDDRDDRRVSGEKAGYLVKVTNQKLRRENLAGFQPRGGERYPSRVPILFSRV
jgi:hypothetical protein